MSEFLNNSSERESAEFFYHRLFDLKTVASKKEGIPPNIAITKDIYIEGIPIRVCLSGVSEEEEPDDYLVIKLGDDLAHPVKHDCIVAKKSGEVYRYDQRARRHHSMTVDDLEVLELVVKTFEDQYSNTSVQP